MFWFCRVRLEMFLNGAELKLNSVISVHSANLIITQAWIGLQDLVSHMCLAGTVVVSWTLIQEMADLSPFTVMTNILTVRNIVNVMVMFSQACLKNSVYGGVSASVHAGIYPPGQTQGVCIPAWTEADTPVDRQLLGRHPPGKTHLNR